MLNFMSEMSQIRPDSLDRRLIELPDIGNRVVDQLQRWDQEVFVEVFSGENLSGRFTNIKEPQAVPVTPPLSQI